MKRAGSVIILFCISISCFSQDISSAWKIIDTLTSDPFWGRGYTNHGMQNAAGFLISQFKSMGMEPLGKEYGQSFSYPVNTFPGQMDLYINGIKLKPGVDFIVAPESRGVKSSGKLIQEDSIHFKDSKNKIEIILREKLTWSVSTEVSDYTRIEINKKLINQPPSIYTVGIENSFEKKFEAKNVCGIIRGTEYPDSMLFITAHYDHLGGMGGDTYFPGANDNASGVSLLLDLASYYVNHPARYSIAFICFAGEEAGLLGSKYFSENPMVPLDQIKFLINVDLTGTGEDGITVVNGLIFKNEMAQLNAINDEKNYLTKIKSRGKASNSDHYWFTERGVRSFFIYTLGGISAYHDIFDRAETLPLTEYEDLFRLIVDFNNELMK